jgi:hypothetical protein
LERFVVNQSFADQCSETEDIMRGEGGRDWWPEKLIAWERATMEKIERRMEALGMWAREGSEGMRGG